MTKLFSIIIPAYNVEQKIEQSLKSVIKQDKSLYECIIIDGNSTDYTVNIIKKYKGEYSSNIKYISEPDNGIYDAMNKGIDMAKGEYLYFLGAGDTLKEGILEKLKPYLNYKPELIYGDVFWKRGGYVINGEFSKERICFMNVCHQSAFYYKALFDIIGKYDLNYHVNADSVFNMCCFGSEQVSIKYIDLVVANYEGGGYSTIVQDDYLKNKPQLILKYLGEKYYNLYNSTDCKVWLDKDFKSYLQGINNIKVAIFGVGGYGQGVKNYIDQVNREFSNKNIEVKYFVDNNDKKWGKLVDKIKVVRPEKSKLEEVHIIVIASMPGKVQIERQLLDMGIEKDKIKCAVQ